MPSPLRATNSPGNTSSENHRDKYVGSLLYSESVVPVPMILGRDRSWGCPRIPSVRLEWTWLSQPPLFLLFRSYHKTYFCCKNTTFIWNQQINHRIFCRLRFICKWRGRRKEAKMIGLMPYPLLYRHFRAKFCNESEVLKCTLKEPIISRFDSRTMSTEVPGLCRLQDTQNGATAPSREIFLQKEWFSQI